MSRQSPLDKSKAQLRSDFFDNLVHLRKTQGLTGRYDVEMQDVHRLQAYDRVECHIVVYPYSRTISSDDVHFYPFEEYVQDVLSRQRSAYSEIPDATDQLFGLLLGLLIALLFVVFDPSSLRQVEALVSIFGTYVVAKELWNDLDRLLINATKHWRLRYQANDYRYQLEKETTLTSYSYRAKRRRYGKQVLLPGRIDFEKQSNSQTLRMSFDAQELCPSGADLAHLYSIQVDERVAADFDGAFMFGVKLSFAKGFLGLSRQLEVFQSLDADAKGCLDARGVWHDSALFYRRTFTLGRLKFYARKGIIPKASLIAS